MRILPRKSWKRGFRHLSGYADVAENGITDLEAALKERIAALIYSMPNSRQIGRIIIRDKEFEKTETKEIKRNEIGG